jgi:hypothetical protein
MIFNGENRHHPAVIAVVHPVYGHIENVVKPNKNRDK